MADFSSAAALAPPEVCPKCNGTGYRIIERDGITAAARCGCEKIGRSQRIEDSSGVPPLYRNASTENFILPPDNPIARNALGAVLLQVRAFVREFPNTDKPGLLFVGDPGTGKTHLAVAVLRALMARGYEGQFCDYQRLLEQIRSGYDKTLESVDREALRTALECEILLLDDLGAHRVSDWVEDTVTSIITQRCNNRKPLIATTNLPDPDAGGTLQEKTAGAVSGYSTRVTLSERIGMRARSRLFEMCKIIKMPTVADYRVQRRS